MLAIKRHSALIMSILGFYGPQTIPSLEKKTKKANHFTSKLHWLTSSPNTPLEDTQIEREIEDSLVQKGFVQSLQFDSIKKKSRIWGLTFKGLIWYFRHSGEKALAKDRIAFFFHRFEEPYEKVYARRSERRKNKLVVEGFKKLIPFCPLWTGMTKYIGEKCLNRLEMTVNSFCVGEKASYRIKSLGLEIETYPNYSDISSEDNFPPEKDPMVVAYLKRKEATLLREAYIAYLIAEDSVGLSKLGQMDVKAKLSKLLSVTELDSFEKDEGCDSPLFSEKSLARFFPTYSSIEYYFTGMFVNNLLWDIEAVDNYHYQI